MVRIQNTEKPSVQNIGLTMARDFKLAINRNIHKLPVLHDSVVLRGSPMASVTAAFDTHDITTLQSC